MCSFLFSSILSVCWQDVARESVSFETSLDDLKDVEKALITVASMSLNREHDDIRALVTTLIKHISTGIQLQNTGFETSSKVCSEKA